MRLDPREVARSLGGEANGHQVLAPAPGHSRHDRGLSVLITDDNDDGFIVNSFNGTDPIEARDYVRQKLGMERWAPKKQENQAQTPKQQSKPTLTLVENYDYIQPDGTPFLRVARLVDERGKKTFKQYKYDTLFESWLPGKPEGPEIPYKLPELLAANPDEPWWLVEGEKSVNYLRSLGLQATTASGGSSKWAPELNEWFTGRDVFVIPDNDDIGRTYARKIVVAIPHAVIVDLPNRAPKDGADDWLRAGNSVSDLYDLALNPPPVLEPEISQAQADDVGHADGDERPGPDLSPTPFEWADPASIPRIEWLYGKHLARGYVSTTIAPGGLGKSSMVLTEALSMTSGRALLGERIPRPLKVWYWSGEDSVEDCQRRIVAAASHHRLQPQDFAHNLFIDSGREKPILVATHGRAGFEVNMEVVAELERNLIANQIDVLILDPFVTIHSVSENDNGAINGVVTAIRRMTDRARIAAELVHHIRKPGAGITADTDVNDARGASALIGAVRSARVLNSMSEVEAMTFNIEHRLSHFRVTNGKSNLAPRTEDGLWRRIVGFDMGNGDDDHPSDNVGVVEAWELPGVFAGLPSNAPYEVQRVAYSGDYREDIRSEHWLGYAIAGPLGMDATDKKQVDRLKKLITIWCDNDVLRRENKPDKQRKMKVHLIPGKALNDEETHGF